MMMKRDKLFWVLLLLFIIGCAPLNASLLSEEEMGITTSLSREKVLSEIKDLSEEERNIIKSEHPQYTYYKLSGNYADYSFWWDFKDDKKIAVFGRGDILTLGGAKVERINNP